MTTGDPFLLICEAIEKLEIVEPYWPGQDVVYDRAMELLRQAKDHLRDERLAQKEGPR